MVEIIVSCWAWSEHLSASEEETFAQRRPQWVHSAVGCLSFPASTSIGTSLPNIIMSKGLELVPEVG